METIPCPGCSTALEPSSTVCPICTRPRGKIEITRAYATLREMEKQRRRRPFVVVVYLLAAAAAGWLVYRFHAPVIALAVSARAHAGTFLDQALDSAVPAPSPAAVPPITPAPSAAPAMPNVASGSSAFPQAVPLAHAPAAPTPGASRGAPPAAAPKAAARPAHVEDLPFPVFDPTTQWALYGRVYDVITLQPIASGELGFTIIGPSSAGPFMNIPTDEDGRFMAILRRLPDGNSYEIHSMRQSYTSAALYESDIPYATLPLSERKEIVRNAQDGDLTLPPLVDVAGENSMRRDVFLAPNR